MYTLVSVPTVPLHHDMIQAFHHSLTQAQDIDTLLRLALLVTYKQPFCFVSDIINTAHTGARGHENHTIGSTSQRAPR